MRKRKLFTACQMFICDNKSSKREGKSSIKKKTRPRDGTTFKHFYIHGIYEQMWLCPCSGVLLLIYKKEKTHVLFPTRCIWIPSVSSQAQVIILLVFFFPLKSRNLLWQKLNSFHNWQAMCLVLIEPHFHLLKWKAHGKSRAPGSDQLLSYWAITTHSNAQSQKTENKDSSFFFEKVQLNAFITHYLAIRHRCAV